MVVSFSSVGGRDCHACSSKARGTLLEACLMLEQAFHETLLAASEVLEQAFHETLLAATHLEQTQEEVLRYKVIVETEKQRKALQAAAESGGGTEGVVWTWLYLGLCGEEKKGVSHSFMELTADEEHRK
eukprot:Em0001g1812a